MDGLADVPLPGHRVGLVRETRTVYLGITVLREMLLVTKRLQEKGSIIDNRFRFDTTLQPRLTNDPYVRVQGQKRRQRVGLVAKHNDVGTLRDQRSNNLEVKMPRKRDLSSAMRAKREIELQNGYRAIVKVKDEARKEVKRVGRIASLLSHHHKYQAYCWQPIVEGLRNQYPLRNDVVAKGVIAHQLAESGKVRLITNNMCCVIRYSFRLLPIPTR